MEKKDKIQERQALSEEELKKVNGGELPAGEYPVYSSCSDYPIQNLCETNSKCKWGYSWWESCLNAVGFDRLPHCR